MDDGRRGRKVWGWVRSSAGEFLRRCGGISSCFGRVPASACQDRGRGDEHWRRVGPLSGPSKKFETGRTSAFLAYQHPG